MKEALNHQDRNRAASLGPCKGRVFVDGSHDQEALPPEMAGPPYSRPRHDQAFALISRRVQE